MTREQRNRVRAAIVELEAVTEAARDRRLSPIGVERTLQDVNRYLIGAMCNLAPAEVDAETYNAEVTVAREITAARERIGRPI